jgi:hypothetical protein
LRKRAAWERTWALQRIEDALEARTQLAEDDPQHLSEAEHAVALKEAGVDKIPVPPKYAKVDFRSGATWTLRGKLDVPKERFVAYPGTRAGADTSPVVGWAGWDHLQPDAVFGERMGQFFDAFVATEAAALGVTREDLAGWRPPAPTRGRRRR